jgi:hypothetical protein
MEVEPNSAAWTQALLVFNLSPAQYADYSWLPSWVAEGSDAALLALSAELLRDRALDVSFDWIMSAGPARLFMIDRDERESLAMAVGIAAHRRSLRCVIRTADLAVLRAAFGEAGDVIWQPAAEAVPHSELPWPVSWASFEVEAARRHMVVEGYRQLLRLVAAAEPAKPAVLGRAQLCAPRTASMLAPDPLPSAAATRLWDSLVRNFLPRWAPSWIWLF